MLDARSSGNGVVGSALKDNAYENWVLRSRLFFCAGAIAVLAIGLFARIAHLQVIQYEHFQTRSDDNRVKIVPLPPTRGLIRDRNGVLLAQNRPTYSLEVVPEAVKDIKGTLAQLGELVEIRPVEMTRFMAQRSSKRRFEHIPIRTRLSEAEVARFAVNRHRFPGVDVHARLTRDYPLGSLASHVLGYVGRIDAEELSRLDPTNYRASTHIGKTGVERSFESILHGRVGYSQVETNAEGRTLRVLERVAPRPGKNLTLSIDIGLQAAAEAAFEGQNGALVAMDPRTGGVLAMVSVPTFDPNLFVHGIDVESYKTLSSSPRRPLFNRALAGQYPPGSTIKPFLALAGMQNNAKLARSRVDCKGVFQIPGIKHRYRDWKRSGHGKTDLSQAIVESCDVFFYSLALEMGIKQMHEFLAKFGFGQRTDVDILGESEGLLPSPSWKRAVYDQPWYPGETLITGIGQGFMLATPLQLAAATAALATQGIRMKPRLVDRIEGVGGGGDGAFAVPASSLGEVRLTAPRGWDRIKTAMVNVVHGKKGTARKISQDITYEMAGKTGTSQVFSLSQDDDKRRKNLAKKLQDHGLFIAFAPADEPRIAIAVVVEHGGGGSASAAPIARRVVDAFLGSKDYPVRQESLQLTDVWRPNLGPAGVPTAFSAEGIEPARARARRSSFDVEGQASHEGHTH